jgi:hypothetical protein
MFQMHGKNIVRVSPALLGRIGETARKVTEGSLVRLLFFLDHMCAAGAPPFIASQALHHMHCVRDKH